MTKIVRDARVLIKRSSISGDIPLPGPSDDHTEWTNNLQIYKGEMFINTTDDKAWIRTENGIVEVALYNLNDGLISPEHLPPSEYLSSLSPTLEVPNDVGGIVAGTKVEDLTGKTFIQMFDELLFPTVLAYIDINNSGSLVGQSSTTVEVGSSLLPSVTASYNPGVINNGDNTTGPNLTGDANQYIFKLPNGTTDATISATSNSQSYTFNSYNVNFGNNVWSVDISYDVGTGTYYDNKGNPDNSLDGSRISGTLTRNTSIVYGRRYIWYGYGTQGSSPSTSSGVRGLPYNDFLNGSNEGEYDILIPSGTQEVYFYIPDNKTASILLVESNADVTGAFDTPTTISVDDASGTSQNYEKWVHFIGATGYSGDVTYRVSIT